MYALFWGWVLAGVGLLVLGGRRYEGPYMSGGQMAAVWFLAPIVIGWGLQLMGVDVLAWIGG